MASPKKSVKKSVVVNKKSSLTINKIETLTPKEIVQELDKYIIGQEQAKKAVAIALRNRGRRKVLDEEIKDEISPKNIIMIGPTGVGKTEIARRISRLVNAPFIKVEATKYTELGYVGRDVESMIRDLVSMSVNMVKEEMRKEVQRKAEKQTEDILLDLLVPKTKKRSASFENGESPNGSREKLKEQLRDGKLETRTVRLKVQQSQLPMIEIFPNIGMNDIDTEFQNLMSAIMPQREKEKKVTVKEARTIIMEQEYDRLIDMEKVASEAIYRVEEMGIVFIDEIDKIAGKEDKGGPDVSREGVQRDILPIVEGSTIHTRFGMIRTDHILFIAAGAFHMSKPSDLIPELQGRFPIRVELEPLSKDDLVQILTQPKNALIKQYIALLATEGIELIFEKEAIDIIANIAFDVNNKTENIGARRLHTILEKLLEEISFNAPDYEGTVFTISPSYVSERLSNIIEDRNLSSYIL